MRLFILFSLAFVTCAEKKDKDEVIESRIIFEFRIDNSNPSSFGFQQFDDGPAISVVSMSIDDNFAYLVDRFHGNLKKINLNSGELEVSEKFQKSFNPWLNDIIINGESLVVLSDLTQSYIVNKEFTLINQIEMRPGEKYFVNKDKSGYTINYLLEDVCDRYTLQHSLQETSNCKTVNIWEKSLLIKAYSKKSLGDKKYITVFDKDIELKTDFPENLLKYEARNMDYTNNKLVYFLIKDNLLRLYAINL